MKKSGGFSVLEKRKKEYKPINLKKIKTYSIRKRKNLVKIEQFGKAIQHRGFNKFIDSLPKILAANDLRK